jgi:hypothetical protein
LASLFKRSPFGCCYWHFGNLHPRLVEKDLEAEQGQDDQGSGDGCGVYRVEHLEGA